MSSSRLSRRTFLANSAKATGGVMTLGVLAGSRRLQAQEEQSFVYEYQNLTPHQGKTIEIMTDFIFPSDDDGPGAKDARVNVYIDRALGSHRAEYKSDYENGIAWFDQYCQATLNAAFADLDASNHRKALMGLDGRREPKEWPSDATLSGRDFFRMVITHTMEGMFCDPSYGGNYNEVGWKLINFPGRAPFGYDPPFSEYDMTIPEIEYPEWKPYSGPMKSKIIGQQ